MLRPPWGRRRLLCLSSLGRPLLRQTAQLLGGGHQGPRVGALDLGLAVDGDLLALLEEHEGGHGRDAVGAGDVLGVVHVDLGERELAGHAVLLSQLLPDGRNLLARRAPVGEEVDGDVGGAGKEGLKLGQR
jgi:hypothetical protein